MTPFGCALQLILWVVLFYLICFVINSGSKINGTTQFSTVGVLARYMHVYMYTITTVVSCVVLLKSAGWEIFFVNRTWNFTLVEAISAKNRNVDYAMFTMVCVYEISDWVINGIILGRMRYAHHVHHVLHLIAYGGAMAWRQAAPAFLLHLLLSEVKELAYPVLQVIVRLKSAATRDNPVRNKVNLLVFSASLLDTILCTLSTAMLWLFALAVLSCRDVLLVFKATIVVYGVLLAIWLKGRCKSNMKLMKCSTSCKSGGCMETSSRGTGCIE